MTMRLSGTVVEIWRLICWTHGRGHGKRKEEGKDKKEEGGEAKGKEKWKGKGREKGR